MRSTLGSAGKIRRSQGRMRSTLGSAEKFRRSQWKCEALLEVPEKSAAVRSAACGTLLQGELKIVLCVVVRDIFNNFGKRLVICREFSVLHPAADHIAQNTSKVFVSGVGQKTSGIGKHSYKAGQIAKVSQ